MLILEVAAGVVIGGVVLAFLYAILEDRAYYKRKWGYW